MRRVPKVHASGARAKDKIKPEGKVMRSVRRSVLCSLLAAFFVLSIAPLITATLSRAQTWPQRPIKFILPLGAGSGVDIGARLFADRLSARWGQPVIVENKPGGDGIVAIGSFVAAHDDHVLLCSPTSVFTAHPYLHDNLPYKPSDLLPIARTTNTVIVIAVPASLNVGSLADLVALARAQPGKIAWAGVTGALDFLFEGFLKREGLSMTKVPYRNPVEAATDLAQDRVQVYDTGLPIVQPFLESGKVKLLALSNSERASIVPGLPTAKEAGYPELTLDGLIGFFGPSDMSNDLRERIAADIRSVAADKVIATRLAATGQILNVAGPTEFAAAIDQQRAKLATIAKELGIVPKQ
jgi:tripartite-type tricarboxylate transporter receptor subunit TctC